MTSPLSQKQLAELIETSFLSPKEKKELSTLLKRSGANDVFYQHFNERLVLEIHKRRGLVEDAFKSFDREVEKLEQEMKKKEDRLSDGLAQALSRAQEDIEEKTRAFEEYSKKRKLLHLEQQEKLSRIMSSQMIALIQQQAT